MNQLRKPLGALTMLLTFLTLGVAPILSVEAEEDTNSSKVVSTTSTYTFTMPDYGLILFAVGEANRYTVRFHGNGNTNTGVTMDDQSMTYGILFPLTTNKYEKTGYTFQGWSTSVNGAKEYSDAQPVSTLTTEEDGIVHLYAVWKANIYQVSFDKNEGVDDENLVSGTMTPQQLTYDAATNLKENAYSRSGYTFQGWSRTQNASTQTYADKASVKNLTTTSGATVTLYAVWSANKTTSYTVNHYQMNVNGSGYTKIATDNLSGETYSIVEPAVKTYEGFSSPETQTGRILGDGTKTFSYYYTRNKYILSFDSDGGTSVEQKSIYYNAELGELENPSKTGYIFTGWYNAATLYTGTRHMPAGNLTLKAKWTPRPDTKYMVYHYLKNVGENVYTLSGDLTQELSGVTASILTLADLSYNNLEGFTYSRAGISGTEGGPSEIVTTGSIEADGSTKVYLYYTRNTHKITLTAGTGIDAVIGATTDVEYGSEQTINATKNVCYSWSGWNGAVTTSTKEYTFTMPDHDVNFTANATIDQYDLTVTADKGASTQTGTSKVDCGSTATLTASALTGYTRSKWTITGLGSSVDGIQEDKTASFVMPANNVSTRAQVTPNPDTKYTVKHIKESLTDDEYLDNAIYAETEIFTGTTDSSITPAVKYYSGFAAPTAQTTTINGNGDTLVIYHYKRNNYNLTLHKGRGINTVNGVGSYKYQQQVTLSAILLSGYENQTWTGTYTTSTFIMPYTVVDMTATSTPINYTISYILNTGTIAETAKTSYTVEDDDIIIPRPIRTGYTFTGWTGTDLDGLTLDVVIQSGSIGNRTYVANWEAQEVMVTVEHYIMQTNGEYPEEPNETVTTQRGLSDTEVTPITNNYGTGFTTVQPEKIYVNPDGSSVVKVYYKRNQYQVTLHAGRGVASVEGAKKYYYEEDVLLTGNLKSGYKDLIWTGDYETNTFKMPYTGVDMTASAIPITYTITYNANSGSITGEKINYTVEDNNFTLAQPTRTGYTFLGWSGSNLSEVTKAVIIKQGSTGNRNYIANWDANNVYVELVYKRMDINGTYPDSLVETGETLRKADSESTISPEKDYGPGFTTPGAQTVTIAPDGSTKVTYLYIRNKFDVSLANGRGVASLSGNGQYYYEQPVSLTGTLKPGYTGLNWTGMYAVSEFSMPAADVSMTGYATTIIYSISYNPQGGTIKNQKTNYTVEDEDFDLVQPSKTGYDFGGWTGTELTEYTKLVTISSGSIGNRTYIAKWIPRNDTAYVIHHYIKEVGKATYIELTGEKQELTGQTDSILTFTTLAKTTIPCATYSSGSLSASTLGAINPTPQTTIQPDGSTNIYLYYSRNTHTITLSGDEHIDELSGSGIYECGAPVEVAATTKSGYHFLEWLKLSGE